MLRAEVMHFLCYTIFIAVPIFRSCPPTFGEALMQIIKLEAFPQA